MPQIVLQDDLNHVMSWQSCYASSLFSKAVHGPIMKSASPSALPGPLLEI